MNDLKAIKTISLAIVAGISLGVLGLVAPRPADAIVIEGYTPNGNFKAVFVTEEGRLPVTGSTSTAIPVFFISSQPVNAFQGNGIPWEMFEDRANATLETGTGFITPGTSPLLVWPTETTRKAASFCNIDGSINIFVGGSAGAVYKLLGPGSCMNPDAPPSYVGPLWIASTATAAYDWFKIKP